MAWEVVISSSHITPLRLSLLLWRPRVKGKEGGQ